MNRVILGVVLALVACGAESQAPNNADNAKLEFEVASVKAVPIEPGKVLMMDKRGGPGTSDPTRIAIENYPMLLLIMDAYHVNFFQLSGIAYAPERFSITAKVPEGATEEQYRLMLQKLLAQRFKLKVHFETRNTPIYEMSVAKNGPPLKPHVGEAVPASAEDPGAREPGTLDKNGFPMPAPGEWGMHRAKDGSALVYQFNLVDIDLPEFASNLSSRIGRTVVDATGLKGKYDLALSCWVDLTPPPSPGGDAGAASSAPAVGPEFMAQQMISAIQKQLGLKLEPKKGPVDILVVDHFEKVPTEN